MKYLISWNVNGIRACLKKGFANWLVEAAPDVCCLQETKVLEEQLDYDAKNPEGYVSHWISAKKKGYSGVSAYIKKGCEPLAIGNLGIEEFDDEGRVMILEYPAYSIINCYFPNSQSEGKRLDYKLAFNNAVLQKCNEIVSNGKGVLLCGDLNVAHTEIDLKNPKTNHKNPGFLPEERQWMTSFLEAGYVDTFRMFTPEAGHYSWWSYRFQARQKDIGWRIDYWCVNDGFKHNVKSAKILKEVIGSDHCPVTIQIT